MAVQGRCKQLTQTDLDELADVTPVTIRAQRDELRALGADDI